MNVFCSNCGGEFGPGEHGFSHCENHPGSRRDAYLTRLGEKAEEMLHALATLASDLGEEILLDFCYPARGDLMRAEALIDYVRHGADV